MKTAQEIENNFVKVFGNKFSNMNKTQVMNAWLENVKRVFENIKNLELTPGWSSEDFNSMVFWTAYLRALEIAVENKLGNLLKLKADYPSIYQEITLYNSKIVKLIETLKGLSTEAGDLALEQKIHERVQWLKEETGLTQDHIDFLALANSQTISDLSLTRSQFENLKKVLLGSKSYRLNQIFESPEEGKTFTSWLKSNLSEIYVEPVDTTGLTTGKTDIPVLPIGIAAVALLVFNQSFNQ